MNHYLVKVAYFSYRLKTCYIRGGLQMKILNQKNDMKMWWSKFHKSNKWMFSDLCRFVMFIKIWIWLMWREGYFIQMAWKLYTFYHKKNWSSPETRSFIQCGTYQERQRKLRLEWWSEIAPKLCISCFYSFTFCCDL